MKNIIAILFTAILINNGISYSQTFEGIIQVELKNHKTNNVQASSYYIKKDKLAMDMEIAYGDQVATTRMIPNLKENKIIVLSSTPFGNIFTELKPEDIENSQAFDTSRLKAEKTGKTQNVAGMECELIIITSADWTIDCWVTQKIDIDIKDFAGLFKKDYNALGLSVLNMTGFALKSITKDMNGNVIATYLVTNVKRQEVLPEEFEIPEGYINGMGN